MKPRPLFRVAARFVGRGLERVADDGPDLLQRPYPTLRERLHHHVSYGRRLDGPCHHGESGRVRGKLAEEIVLGSPPTTFTVSTVRPVRLRACSMAYLYLSARLSNTHRAMEAGSSGRSCPVSSQKLRMRDGKSPGERNVGWSGSTSGPAGGASSARWASSS